nr:hypothetical protein [Tanacetum cinerariifolium]
HGSKAKEHAPKALMAIDGVGWDWSYMVNDEDDHALVADEEASTEFALMANTSTESKLALAQVEFRLVEYKEREVKYIEKIRTLEYYHESKKECIETLKKELETLKQEKEVVDKKLASLFTALKDLDNLIESQSSDKSKEECADDTVTDYSRPSPTVESSSEEDQNGNPFENVASPITPKPFIKFVKASDSQSKSSTKNPTADMGMKGKAINPSACWTWKPSQNLSNKGLKKNSGSSQNHIDDKGYWDSGCSRHMTGNISYLSDYEPFEGGYVSFGQGGCKITRKGTIKTGILEFENVYFVKDLKMYLVRGLPTKCFENDHNCNACMKGKQHKSSCKSELVNSASKPLHTLHMDLFGPTSVSSISHKWYCLVVTDDFSRFAWTFFLKTKNETSGILRKFITEIENLKDLKVKIIRCDNGGEFRNKELNDFCSQKGIKREFSNARNPQQNGVAKRRNRLLIEAARTMLADAKLPVTFWTEVVNTACYVQNRVLVNKAHNKTPYELFKGRTPAIGFLKPFGCHVMILNTLDNLEHLESTSSQPQDACNTDAPECSRNSNPTATSINPPTEQLKTLTVETPIPTVSSPVPTVCFTDSQELSSETRLISKRVTNQEETPSLDNILTSSNQFEDILGVTTNTEESNGVEADVNNMETIITASPTLTFRIHRDHPKSQIIGPLNTTIQTRNKSKERLVDCPKGVRPIRTKWVLKNKKDERGIVIRNKARLVAQEHTHEEGINYDEVFAPVARIEAIRLFLAYASFMGFTPPRFQDLEYPARVYKVEKAMYGLHQAPRAWQRGDFILVQVYVDDIIFGSSNPQLCREFEALMHEKIQMSAMDVRSSNTPMDKENPWGKDGTGKDVDLHLYRSMIGSLMYLIASRPDIMFAVCACARHQVKPKECHLHAVKRIFRYLKVHSKLGLWYPKDSPFDLMAYSDSDYGGATQDRKSTTGGCQFLGKRLISWQCKKQTIVATSTTEA